MNKGRQMTPRRKRSSPPSSVCQYRLSELDPEDSLEILERHPLTLVGGQVYVNDKYAS